MSEVRAIRETGVVPVGDMIVRNTFEDQKKEKVSELLSWACDSKEQDLATMTLAELTESARSDAVMNAAEGDLEQRSYQLF